MGAMRLLVIASDDGRIDETEAAEMVAYAMEHGVNYYDTFKNVIIWEICQEQ